MLLLSILSSFGVELEKMQSDIFSFMLDAEFSFEYFCVIFSVICFITGAMLIILRFDCPYITMVHNIIPTSSAIIMYFSFLLFVAIFANPESK